MRTAALFFLSAGLLLGESRVRLIGYDGGVLRLGVSTDKVQYSITSSTDRTNWTDRGRTWVLYGGTNEIVLSIALPVSQKATYVKLAP